MLVGDAFGGFGGIAKFNRDFLTALCEQAVQVRVLPRSITEPVESGMPGGLVYDRRAAAGKGAFARRLAACLTRRGHINAVICGHINLLPAAWLLARLRRARLVLVIHGFEAWGRVRSSVVHWLARRVDAVVSVSRTSAERFCGWSGFDLERVSIVPNCVDLDRFQPQPKDTAMMQRLGLGGGPVILTLGRIFANERYKGFDEVIDLMPRLLARDPSLQYLIVGDGNDRVRLESKVEAMQLAGAVVFAGRIDEADKVGIYNLADAYVMPSSGEGFGIVLLEAAACGIPVVGSSIDGSRDALRHGELGRLVDPHNSDALFDAIVATLAAGRRERPAGLDMFSEQAFKNRVSAWTAQLCKN